MQRTVYLEDIPKDVALEKLMKNFKFLLVTEVIPTSEALGRFSAAAIFAKHSVPHYHASAMDGIAVVSADTYKAHEKRPLRLTPDKFVFVDTGNPIPKPFDAVIMIEYVQELDDGSVELIQPATPWQHIRPIGEDITEEEMLFTKGHQIRAVDIGALLSCGVKEVTVIKKPQVAIIPTGNELISSENIPQKGEITEYNGTVFASYLKEWGATPLIYPIISDNKQLIKNAILDALSKSEFVIINAGSSAGRKDYTAEVIAELGEVFVHGVACRPGKPVILGKINKKIVVGLPGYPVSAYLGLEWFVKPLVEKYLSAFLPKRQKLSVVLGRRIVATMGAEDFIRVSISYVNNKYIAVPLSKSAGVTMSLVRADGLLVIPAAVVGYEAGEAVQVELLKPLEEITQALVFNGSHDMALDYVASLWKKTYKTPLTSTHSGSMAGILAIKKGEAHVAGIHLLDPRTKQYNVSYIKKMAGDQKLVLQPFLKRMQGLIVPKGNPQKITTIDDIVACNAEYVNRQKGSGTRILLDLLLEEKQISQDLLKGYNREFFSHLSVAAEVANSDNGVGLGIYAAAKILNLDFVPIAEESYDLLMTQDFYESPRGQKLISLLRSDSFSEQVASLDGYKLVVQQTPQYF